MFSSNTSQVSNAANYIEDVFSTYLYTGTGVARTITNGIDLSTYGGLVWTKRRSTADYHALFDTARTINYALYTNTTSAQTLESNSMTSYGTSGYSIGSGPALNSNTNTFVSWTFREQPKFFDVVTWTGDGATSKTISHNLGATPGCIITKSVSYDAGVNDSWYVYHRGLTTPNNKFLRLSSTNAVGDIGSNMWNVTSTTFSVLRAAELNTSGQTYVAYLFAHDAGGFGLTGTDNVISCGSYTGTGTAGLSVTLGYEPQWLLVKNASSSIANWVLVDNMRGFSKSSTAALFPNLSEAEITWSPDRVSPNATGFTLDVGTDENLNKNGSTLIYIAIRRGPMKVPTSGTSVFSPNATSGTTNTQITTNFPLDLNIVRDRTASTGFQSGFAWSDRLRELASTNTATTTGLQSTNTNAETTGIWGLNKFVDNIGFKIAADYSGLSQIYYSFRRAPSFFDEVCYTGTGSARTINHNLGVAPELMIVKRRDNIDDWGVYAASYPSAATGYFKLNTTQVFNVQSGAWNNTAPTASVFTVGNNAMVNASGGTYVAYLFATCAGVSKVGSYTGTGTGNPQTIDCGFTAGARFVLIRKTSATGSWWVWDSARGIVASVDPYLALDQNFAEDFNGTSDSVDTHSTGFIVNENAQNNVNSGGATYIFLAIA